MTGLLHQEKDAVRIRAFDGAVLLQLRVQVERCRSLALFRAPVTWKDFLAAVLRGRVLLTSDTERDHRQQEEDGRHRVHLPYAYFGGGLRCRCFRDAKEKATTKSRRQKQNRN